jgi:hypothetical protein
MESPGETPKPHPSRFGWARKFLYVLSIIAAVLYVMFLLLDANQYRKEVKSGEVSASATAYTDAMQASVQRQLADLSNVDASALLDAYTGTLATEDCNWVFVCHPKPGNPTYWITDARGMLVQAEPVFQPGGGFPVPTGHTFRGTPHALWRAMAKIIHAGGWAIAMFLSCTVLWAALLLRVFASKQGAMSYLPYLLIVAAPFWISFMVMGVQWVGEVALARAGWAVGLAAIVVAHSGALAVLVGIPHVLKSPREIREAAEGIRRIS